MPSRLSREVETRWGKTSRAVEWLTDAIFISRVQASYRKPTPIRDAREPPSEGDSLGALQLNGAFN